ncbi:helix-turn-helix domain-containing protein [Achromobacter mucicolens]|uniref:helix-turn-helix domain-containing protein n=1 Tax=Achromobacter mucicolens TaxID=1389922 RepID=UPI002897E9F0|nr:helix-turn-helix domain-containing protein [Achromobacter mucicolens]
MSDSANAHEVHLFPGEALCLADGRVIRAAAQETVLSWLPPVSVEWAPIIRELKDRGWTQQRVADALGCSQAAISQLNTGRHAEPSYAVGVGLLALLERIRGEASHA